MAADRAWKDEFTLLCERCGYVLEGLPQDGSCPECAKPIAESLPSRRNLPTSTGRFWFVYVNCWRAIRHPLRTLDRTPIDDRVIRAGLWTRIHAAAWFGLSLFLGITMMVIADARSVESNLELVMIVASGLSTALFIATLAFLLIQFLTWVEVRGLMVFGGRRGSRITPRVSRCICAHGSAGWMIASMGFVPLLIGFPAIWMLNVEWDELEEHTIPSLPGWVLDAAETAPLVTLAIVLLGFLFFEVFAWLGLRRLKFANTA